MEFLSHINKKADRIQRKLSACLPEKLKRKIQGSCLVGIDIDGDSVRCISLDHKDGQYQLTAISEVALPTGTVVDRKIENQEMLSEALIKAIEPHRQRGRQAAIALPNANVFTKVVQYDADQSDQDIEQQLLFDAEKHIPYGLDEIYLDFQILHPNVQHPEKNDVLLAAARHDVLDDFSHAVEEVNMPVAVVDVEKYALWHACKELCLGMIEADDDGQQAIALLNVSQHYAYITVVRGDDVLYSHEQRVRTDSNIFEFIQRWAQRAIELFYTSEIEAKLDQVLIFGSLVENDKMVSDLSKVLQLPVAIADPFLHMEVAAQVQLPSNPHRFLLACGLAMRRVDDHA